jgi:CHAT domain-containing protein
MGRLIVARRLVGFFLLAYALLATIAGPGRAQTATSAAPAGTVADITAILDQQKPDPGAASKMRATADQPPPAGAGAAALARFYYKRGEARSVLGRYADALADADSAFAAGKGHLPPTELGLIRQLQGLQYSYMGDPKKALELYLTRAQEAIQTGNKGSLFNTYRYISGLLIHTGDLSQAETYVRKVQALMSEARTWAAFPLYGSNWQAELHEATGGLAEARGLLVSARWPVAPPRSQFEFNIDSMISAQGRVKARQGRLAEAEAGVRQALLNRLTAAGKYTTGTAQQASALADVLAAQGRYPEAEKLARTTLDIYRTIGLADDTQPVVGALTQVANIINLQGHAREAARIFDQIDAATKSWEPRRREQLSVSVPRISTLYRTGRVQDGITAAQTLVARNTARFGANSFNTAYARGALAIGLAFAGRDAEALSEFKLAIPILLSSETDDDDPMSVALREHEIQTTVERYMALLVRAKVDIGADAAVETFDKTEFALLPRLPDTRLELIAMARALDIDPSKALFLGRDANERNVETIDLSRFRNVAFATHGLLPGDLDGLTQPALALTAPQIAGVAGGGLLTLEKVLPLKLDADWVVLSACNTGAGAGAGAEAASGLGRAFFYAGTRALLVTNWSVHSASARELITDLFRRQSADPHLPRAEALRQAMMSLLDGPGFVDGAGKAVFTNTHPLFWAPYSIIGDGGGT